jgi:hypothetical protein
MTQSGRAARADDAPFQSIRQIAMINIRSLGADEVAPIHTLGR